MRSGHTAQHHGALHGALHIYVLRMTTTAATECMLELVKVARQARWHEGVDHCSATAREGVPHQMLGGRTLGPHVTV